MGTNNLKKLNGIELCIKCNYWSDYSKGCSYLTRNEQSRIYKGGKERTVPKGYCDTFKRRPKNTQGVQYKKQKKVEWEKAHETN